MIIDQLTARGVMEASALYEQPFNGLSGGGPEALFAEKTKLSRVYSTPWSKWTGCLSTLSR